MTMTDTPMTITSPEEFEGACEEAAMGWVQGLIRPESAEHAEQLITQQADLIASMLAPSVLLSFAAGGIEEREARSIAASAAKNLISTAVLKFGSFYMLKRARETWETARKQGTWDADTLVERASQLATMALAGMGASLGLIQEVEALKPDLPS